MKAIIKLFGTALILLLVTTVNAQFSYGVKGGYTFQNVTATSSALDVLPLKSNNSFTLGGVAEYSFTNNFALQGEVNFVRKGFVIKEGLDLDILNIPLPLGVTATTNIKYIDIPLLAKYKFGNSERAQGYVVAGPTFGYARNGNLKTEANILIDINLTNTPINFDALNMNRWEVGGAIGLGGSVNLSGTQLFADARYTRSLTKLDNLPVIDLDLANQGVALTAGVLIPINKKKGGFYASK